MDSEQLQGVLKKMFGLLYLKRRTGLWLITGGSPAEDLEIGWTLACGTSQTMGIIKLLSLRWFLIQHSCDYRVLLDFSFRN